MQHNETFKKQLGQSLYDFDNIKKYIFEILKFDERKGLIIAGGIVPYLVMDKSSDRQHENIDFVCKIDDIDYYRQLFLRTKKYTLIKDSVDNNNGDYGFVYSYKGIPVGIYPFFEKNNCIYEKNYYYYSNEQFVRIIKGITENQYVFEKNNIKYMSLEIILKKKLMQNRPKDQKDINLFIDYGVDLNKANKIIIEEVK